MPEFYAFSKWEEKDRFEWLFEQLKTLPLEENQCINHYESIGFHTKSALDPRHFVTSVQLLQKKEVLEMCFWISHLETNAVILFYEKSNQSTHFL